MELATLAQILSQIAQEFPAPTWDYVWKVGGPAGVALVAAGYGFYRAAKHVWDNFLIARLWDQLIIPLRDKHFKYLDTQTVATEKNTGTLTELANNSRQHVGLLEKLTTTFDTYMRSNDERMSRLTALAENANTLEQMKTRQQEKMVLVVDDDAAARTAIKLYASATGGCGVLVAATGRQAIDTLKASIVDLLLLDIGIPAPDGNDVLRWVEANRHEMPVIVITGDKESVSSDVARIPRRILTKPMDPRELVNIMRQELYAA